MVYQARMLRVDCPKRFPINSGNVVMRLPKYRGAKTKASRHIKTNAYQAYFPETIPVVNPALAEAINMEGPTFVPHMEKPI